MTLNEFTGGPITLVEAEKLTKSFREMFPNQAKAFFIGSLNIQAILDQENCVGIRIYNGYNDEDKCLNPLLVGVDKDGKDMTNGLIMDRMTMCPTVCDQNSPLAG
jgi:hypothetical protein